LLDCHRSRGSEAFAALGIYRNVVAFGFLLYLSSMVIIDAQFHEQLARCSRSEEYFCYYRRTVDCFSCFDDSHVLFPLVDYLADSIGTFMGRGREVWFIDGDWLMKNMRMLSNIDVRVMYGISQPSIILSLNSPISCVNLCDFDMNRKQPIRLTGHVLQLS
jgi:hypothetical protein